RVWVATEHRFKDTGEMVEKSRDLVPLSVALPASGIFLGGANWVQLASDRDHVFGIKADGSLWKIFSVTRTNVAENLSAVPVPERIGTDAEWKSVVAGWMHFLMLKKDGSLWGWGRNDNGQLGPGPAQLTNEL